MKKLSSWIYLILTVLSIAGTFWVMFITENSPSLIVSPYVGLAIMTPLTLLAFFGFVHSAMEKPDNEEEAKEKIVEAIIIYSRIFYANHRYPPDSSVIRDVIEYSLKFKHDPRPKCSQKPQFEKKVSNDGPFDENT